MIRERELCVDLTIESVIRPLYDRIPVSVRSRRSGRTVEQLEIASDRLAADILTEARGFRRVAGSTWAVGRETKGVARLVYGAEQVVDVSTTPLGDPPAAIAAAAAVVQGPGGKVEPPAAAGKSSSPVVVEPASTD